MLVNHESDIRSINQNIVKDLNAGFDSSERSAEYPLIVPMNHDLDNDIYFIGKQSNKIINFS